VYGNGHNSIPTIEIGFILIEFHEFW
jgi:hypothetical protein